MKFRTTRNIESDIYNDALNIRKKVFVHEQNVDETIEIDEYENKALHIIGYDKQIAACTARLLEKEKNTVKIQRVAVLKEYRGNGVGSDLLSEIDSLAKNDLKCYNLRLGAQKQAIPFYERNGFTVVGNEYFDAGIPHYDMEKKLT